MLTSLESGGVVELTVLRHQGNSGRVVVSWIATAALDSSAITVQPHNGTVRLQSVSLSISETTCQASSGCVIIIITFFRF